MSKCFAFMMVFAISTAFASDVQYEKFFSAKSTMGGSVVVPLVKKLNDLSESNLVVDKRAARLAIMQQISGSIGPIEYTRSSRSITTTRTGQIGSFSGSSSSGGFIDGAIYGSTSSTRTKDYGYRAVVSPAFKSGLEDMVSLARRGFPDACAEVGASIFVDATRGMIGLDERRGVDFFKKASNAGNVYGKFMHAFCLYYGIGGKEDRTNARKLLIEMQSLLKNKEVHRDAINITSYGWCSRRLAEARQMGMPFGVDKIHGAAIEHGEAMKNTECGVQNLKKIVLVDTAEDGAGVEWKYSFEQPADNWNDIEYNDDGWIVGISGFGYQEDFRSGSDAFDPFIRTKWFGWNIWMRKEFVVKTDLSKIDSVCIRECVDDRMDIWLNGIKIQSITSVVPAYKECDDSEVRANFLKALKHGKNVLAIKAWNAFDYKRRGVNIRTSYVDVGVSIKCR